MQSNHSVDQYEPSLTPDSLGKLGMWLFLVSDAMSFGALLAAYGAIRAGAALWPPPSELLGISLTAVMTFLLICSSVTMVKALEAIQNGRGSEDVPIPWAYNRRRRNLLGASGL